MAAALEPRLELEVREADEFSLETELPVARDRAEPRRPRLRDAAQRRRLRIHDALTDPALRRPGLVGGSRARRARRRRGDPRRRRPTCSRWRARSRATPTTPPRRSRAASWSAARGEITGSRCRRADGLCRRARRGGRHAPCSSRAAGRRTAAATRSSTSRTRPGSRWRSSAANSTHCPRPGGPAARTAARDALPAFRAARPRRPRARGARGDDLRRRPDRPVLGARGAARGARSSVCAPGARVGERAATLRSAATGYGSDGLERGERAAGRRRGPDPLEQFARDRDVVGREVRAVVEDRAGALGRLGVGDRGAHDAARSTRSPKRSRSEPSASREWTVRMSARFIRMPRTSSEGFRLSRAMSISSIACSTPCSAKYWASAVISARSAATSPLTVSSPSEGGQSTRIRSYSSCSGASARRASTRGPSCRRASAPSPRARGSQGRCPSGSPRRPGAPREDVGDRRLDIGRQVEVVREVALRVEVDGEHAQRTAPQHVGQRPDRRRLSGARPSERGR